MDKYSESRVAPLHILLTLIDFVDMPVVGCFCKNKSCEIFEITFESGETLFQIKNCFNFLLFDRALEGVLKNRASAGSLRYSEVFQNKSFVPIDRPIETLYEVSKEFGQQIVYITSERAGLLSCQIEETLVDALEWYGCEECGQEVDLLGYQLQRTYLAEIRGVDRLEQIIALFERSLSEKPCCLASAFVKSHLSRLQSLFDEFVHALSIVDLQRSGEKRLHIVWTRNPNFRKSLRQ